MRFIFWGPGGMLKLTKYIYIKKKPKLKAQTRSKRKANKIKTNPEAESLELSLRFLLSAHWRQKVPVPAAAKNTHATTQLRHVLAADSLTRHHDRHEPPTASEPQPKTVAVLPTASPHVSLISPLSNQRQSTTTVPKQPQSTTETHDRSSRQQASSPRVHDNNLSEPASAKKGKLMEFVAADLFVCDWIWSFWFVHFDECEQLKY